MLTSNKNILYLITVILFIIAVGLYFTQFENIPYAGDEYYVIFKFLLSYNESPHFFLFIDSYNEHINVMTRSIALLSQWIGGKFSFYSFYTVGLISYVIFLSLLIREYFNSSENKINILASVIILFFFTYHSVMSFSLVSIQYYTTSMFAFFSFFLALRSSSKLSIILSIFSALIATFTFGNGAFSFVVIGVVFMETKTNQKITAVFRMFCCRTIYLSPIIFIKSAQNAFCMVICM